VQGPPGPAQGQVWSAFVPSAAARITTSTFTPDVAITVTRIQAQAINAPANCSQPAILALNDTASCSVAMSAAANDSGPRVCNFAAGSAIRLTILQTPTCTGKGAASPSNINVVVQYKAQTP
jgi:hypothetical protein